MQARFFTSSFIGISFAVLFLIVFVMFSGNMRTTTETKRLLKMLSMSEDLMPGENTIPARIIHQSWKTHEVPRRFQRWQSTWQKCFPNWQYKLWSDDENRRFLSVHYPWFIKYYDNFTWHIHRVDSVRYFYLFHYGGLYTDLDNECLKPFPHLLKNYSLVFGAMNGQYASYIKEGYVQNSLMYSRPRHPFWMEMIHEVIARVKSTAPPEAVTGPITLVKCINEYRKRHTNDIKVYPPDFFNPNSWLNSRRNGCKDFNKMNEEDEKRCKESHKRSYVIQYHTQTWGRGKVKE